MAVVSWYEESPERLAWELQRFEDAGLVVQQGLTGAGLMEVITEVEFREAPLRVQILFPLDYPDKAPELYGEPGLLKRHQGLGGNFCVLEDPANDWSPEHSAADLVAVNLRNLLDDWSDGSEKIAAGEADYPEPVTGFFDYGDLIVVVTDPFLDDLLPATQGDMILSEMSAAALLLMSCEGLGVPDAGLVSRMLPKSGSRQKGSWISLDSTPTVSLDLAPLLTRIEEVSPRAFNRITRRLKKRKVQKASQWVGITFPEEGPIRGQSRRSWIFLEVTQSRGQRREVVRVARAQGLNLKERQRRIPELSGVSKLRILLVGAGSLGGSIAMEFARAGVAHIDIVDPDSYDVNNSVRHVLRPRLAGLNKALAVATECEELNPFITVTGHSFSVGGSQEASERLDELIRDVDIVLDVTASASVARILQKRCRVQEKALVVAALTSGSYGGEVAVFRARGGCYQCLVFQQADGQLPSPPEGPRENVVPVGCSHPAFLGAGFDASELAAITARTLLRATGALGYPPLDYDWAVISFRSEPRWQQGSLERHEACTRPH